MADPETLEYCALPEDLATRAIAACDEAMRGRARERGVEAEGWARLASVSVSASPDPNGDHWLRLLAGDGTSWYLGWNRGDFDDLIRLAADFGTTLADDILPWDR